MKTKLLLLLGLSATVSASAQDTLIAGWDFGQFAFDGFAVTNPQTLEIVSSIDADYSGATGLASTQPHEVGTGTPFSAGRGVFSWLQADADNQSVFGSSNGSTTVNTTTVSFPGTELSNLASDPSGQALNFFNAGGLSFTVTVDLSGYSAPATAFPLAFAGYAEGATSISWSFNGTPSGLTTVLPGDSTYSAYNVALPGSYYGSVVTIVGTITGSDVMALDNFQVNGQAIPEPSTCAAVAGVAGLGMFLVRRRSRV